VLLFIQTDSLLSCKQIYPTPKWNPESITASSNDVQNPPQTSFTNFLSYCGFNC